MTIKEKDELVYLTMYKIEDKFDRLVSMEDALSPYIKADAFNILMFMDSVSDFFQMAYIKDIEKEYNTPVHLIIRPEDEIIMQIYDFHNYDIVNIYEYFAGLKQQFKNIELYNHFVRIMIRDYRTKCKSKLEKGKLSIISENSDHYKQYSMTNPASGNITENICTILGMPHHKIDISSRQYKPSDDNLLQLISYQLSKTINLEKTVIIFPETEGVITCDKRIWQQLVNNIKKLGFSVLEHISNPENHINGADNLSIEYRDWLYMASNCHSVFTANNLFAYALAEKGKDMYVLWLEDEYKELGEYLSYSTNFDLKNLTKPHVHILSSSAQLSIPFEDYDIGINIPQSWVKAPSIKQKIALLLRKHKIYAKTISYKYNTFNYCVYFLTMPVYKVTKGLFQQDKEIFGIPVNFKKLLQKFK